MSIHTCFLNPPQNRLNCPMTWFTSSFNEGCCSCVGGTGVVDRAISYGSRKFMVAKGNDGGGSGQSR